MTGYEAQNCGLPILIWENMKKLFKWLFILFVTLAFFTALAGVFLFFYAPIYFSPQDPGSCVASYVGINKGMVWRDGEWHHYVEFAVDNQMSFFPWEVVEQPLPSSFWNDDPATPHYKRIGYRWPRDWWDPFPARTWKICLTSS